MAKKAKQNHSTNGHKAKRGPARKKLNGREATQVADPGYRYCGYSSDRSKDSLIHEVEYDANFNLVRQESRPVDQKAPASAGLSAWRAAGAKRGITKGGS